MIARGGPLVVLHAADLDPMEKKVLKEAGGEITERHEFSGGEHFPFPRSQRQRARHVRRTMSSQSDSYRPWPPCPLARMGGPCKIVLVTPCPRRAGANPQGSGTESERYSGPVSCSSRRRKEIELRRVLGDSVQSRRMLGIGAIVGAEPVFVITGHAAAEQPAPLLSFPSSSPARAACSQASATLN